MATGIAFLAPSAGPRDHGEVAPTRRLEDDHGKREAGWGPAGQRHGRVRRGLRAVSRGAAEASGRDGTTAQPGRGRSCRERARGSSQPRPASRGNRKKGRATRILLRGAPGLLVYRNGSIFSGPG